MKHLKKIDSVEMYGVRLPLVKPFETSFSVQTHREALLLKITSDGVSGWGECVTAPDPYYCYETNSTSSHIIKGFLIPILMTLKNFSIETVLEKFDPIRGHNMAKAAVENALLDLLARQYGIPLFQLIGGEDQKIMSGISIGIKDHMDDLFESIQGASDKKYHRIKIKIKKGKDVEVLKAVRKTFPFIRLMADANADYALEDIHLLKELDAFDLMMIEQPLNYDDIYFHSFLQKQIDTPVCLDESIKNLNDAKTAVANHIDVWSGGMLETGIGRAFNIHLQTLPGFVLPGDTSETARYFTQDIVDKPVVLEPDGFIKIPEGAGTGVRVLSERLDRFKVFYEKIA
ncbi:MAG: o-succinylbenzoate synthase [Deltaproteobacteria bacterium]|nr:o-succinylbenzoate synthase [Deltaproteobacteria bacterium]